MLIKLTDDLQRAIEIEVRNSLDEVSILDVNATAEGIRRRFAEHNVAHEDIAASVTKVAVRCGCPIAFVALAPQQD